jgi:hypothetical protein
MSCVETADHHNDVASRDAADAFHASRASDLHVSSTAESVSGEHMRPEKYDKTAVILIGWEKEFCDTGVAPEVSSHTQPFPNILC